MTDDARYIVRQAWQPASRALAHGAVVPFRMPVISELPAAYSDYEPDCVPVEYVEFTEHTMGFGVHEAKQIRGTYNGQSFVCGGPTLAEFARSFGRQVEETEVRV